jgi:hypothetical protein
MFDAWSNQAGGIKQAIELAESYISLLTDTDWTDNPYVTEPSDEPITGGGGLGGGTKSGNETGPAHEMYHEGGIVNDNFSEKTLSESLKPNEVYAKLMKGEFVSTEDQMNRFITKTLPSLIGRSSSKFSKPQTNITEGDINFDIDISVAGSLDKDAVPELKNSILGEVNKALNRSGITRNSIKFSI